MKVNGLMAIALLFSGAAFAQQTSVKTAGSVHVNSETSANTGSSNANINNSTTTGTISSQQAAGATVSQSAEQLSTVAAATANNGVEIEHAANSTLNAATSAGASLGNAVNSTVKTASGINTTLNHTLNMKTAPIRINTGIGGGAVLGIL